MSAVRSSRALIAVFLIMASALVLTKDSKYLPQHQADKLFHLSPGQVTHEKAQCIRAAFTRLPLSFEANHGQAPAGAHFVAKGPGYTVLFTDTEVVLGLARPRSPSGKVGLQDARGTRGAAARVLRTRLVGGNPRPRITGLDPQSGRSHYLLGNDPRRWRRNIRHYARVKYQRVYPGVDLVYYGNQRQLEYDFIVAPGADYRQIKIAFEGADRLEIERTGDLIVHLPDGQVRQHKPYVYQEEGGERQPVQGEFVLTGPREVGFRVAAYDPARPLVIDPVLRYSTYLGGSDGDFATGIAVDGSGNAYVTGWTLSFDQPEVRQGNQNPMTDPPVDPPTDGPGLSAFPIVNAFQGDLDRFAVPPLRSGVAPYNFNSYEDAFISKFNATGSQLIYSTYYGGGGHDRGLAIAVNAAGEAHITGHTDEPLPPNGFTLPLLNPIQTRSGGGLDAFILKLNAAGTLPIFSTYLGGAGTDVGRGIAVDARGNIHVTGSTDSTNFNTYNAFQNQLGGSTDAFVTNLNASGTAFNYSTYLGGLGTDSGNAITADAQGNAYITGETTSTNFPTAATMQAHGGGNDAFVTKLNPFGDTLIYSTYLGGSNHDAGRGIAIDTDQNVYVAGLTNSTDFPTVNPIQSSLRGGFDAFVAKLNPAATALIYSTYLGGSNSDLAHAIAVSPSGHAYVAGETFSTNFPVANHLQAGLLGFPDGFVTKLAPSGQAFEYSTYLGGPMLLFDGTRATGIAVDGLGTAFVTGSTGAFDFPHTLGAFQPVLARPRYTGSRLAPEPPGIRDEYGPYTRVDVFVSRIGSPPLAPSDLTITFVSSTEIHLAWTDNSDNEASFEIERKAGGGNFTPVGTVGRDVVVFQDSGLIPGTTYTYRVRATNQDGNSPYSNQASATTLPEQPEAPTGLAVTTIDRTRLRLNWTDNTVKEAGFRIERKLTNGGSYGLVAIVGSNVTTYLDTGLTPNTRYTYRVFAFNPGGDSDPSNEAEGQTLPNPPSLAPGTLAATAVSNREVDLTWTDANSDEDGFQVERKPVGGVFALVRILQGADITSYRDSGLSAETTYIYRVRAYNVSGVGPWSNEASVTTLPDPPVAPANLVAVSVGGTQIDLSWQDNSNNETGFEIERSTDGTTFTLLATVAADVTSYSDSSGSLDTQYFYRVRAMRTGSGSAYSNVASAYTRPIPPSDLTAVARSDTRVDLAWTDNSTSEIRFDIERRTPTTAFVTIGNAPANATTFSDTGLAENTAYIYRVRAVNSGGPSDPSNEVMVITLLRTPSNLTAVAVATDRINLTWTDNTDLETNYRVERSTDGVNFTGIALLPADSEAYEDTGLSSETTYFYRVRADSADNVSAYSNTASATTLPPAPTGLAAVAAGNGAISLSWTDNSQAETGFKIERAPRGGSFAEIATVGPNVTTYLDTGLAELTTYVYRVRASGSGGDSPYSNEAEATTPLNAPANLTAQTISNRQIDLQWADNSNIEDSYRIERSDDGVLFSVIATVPANTTTFADTGLAGDTVYHYRVKAASLGIESAPSNTASARTLPDPPAAPSGLAVSVVSQTELQLTWTDNANNEDGFRVERSLDGSSFQVIATLGASTGMGSTVQHLDSGLAVDTRYFYRVQAFNAGGDSNYSEVVSARTLPNPPAAPLSLTATAVTRTSVTLAWTDRSNNEDGFRIERSRAGQPFASVGEVGPGVTVFTDGTLSPATQYRYRVVAFNAGGDSPPSNEVTVTTRSEIPNAPTGLTARVNPPRSIALQWTDASDNETGFHVERRTGSSNFEIIATLPANQTSFEDVNVQPAVTYTYRVLAIHPVGPSSPSNTASATLPVGGKLKVTPQKVKFPDTALGSSRTARIVVQNVGKGPLAVNMTDPTGDFRLETGRGAFSLAPGESHTLTVRYSPTIRGKVTATFTLFSTDRKKQTVRVTLLGRGV